MSTRQKSLLSIAAFLTFVAFIPKIFTLTSATIYVDMNNLSGVEDGTLSHPFKTIRQGIAAASYGDTVLVSPGVYNENLVLEEGMTLEGRNPETTIIQGTGTANVITTAAHCTIKKFTIKNSRYPYFGISAYTAETFPHASAGEYVAIIENIITSDWNGLGISNYALVMNNIICGNGNIGIYGDYLNSETLICNNLIVENDSGIGFGGNDFAMVLNNTIANNSYSGILTYWNGNPIIRNNIISGNPRGIHIFNSTATISFNDVWNSAINNYNDYNASAPREEWNKPFIPYPGTGELSIDPMFINPGIRDFRLLAGSSCIDAGDIELVPVWLDKDMDGNPRIRDGNRDGITKIDMGAYEYQIPNSPPFVECKKNVVFRADENCRANIKGEDLVDAYDLDGDALTYTCDPAAPFPLGVTPVKVSVSDGVNENVEVFCALEVTDQTPPVISALSATPHILWPPNNKMVPVVINVAAMDNCSSQLLSEIVNVKHNEPNDKNPEADWMITGKLTLSLRAERLGTGNGRIYTITIQCKDTARNNMLKDVFVIVPKNEGI